MKELDEARNRVDELSGRLTDREKALYGSATLEGV